MSLGCLYGARADNLCCSGVPGNRNIRKVFAWLSDVAQLFDPPEVRKVSTVLVNPVKQLMACNNYRGGKNAWKRQEP